MLAGRNGVPLIWPGFHPPQSYQYVDARMMSVLERENSG